MKWQIERLSTASGLMTYDALYVDEQKVVGTERDDRHLSAAGRTRLRCNLIASSAGTPAYCYLRHEKLLADSSDCSEDRTHIVPGSRDMFLDRALPRRRDIFLLAGGSRSNDAELVGHRPGLVSGTPSDKFDACFAENIFGWKTWCQPSFLITIDIFYCHVECIAYSSFPRKGMRRSI